MRKRLLLGAALVAGATAVGALLVAWVNLNRAVDELTGDGCPW